MQYYTCIFVQYYNAVYAIALISSNFSIANDRIFIQGHLFSIFYMKIISWKILQISFNSILKDIARQKLLLFFFWLYVNLGLGRFAGVDEQVGEAGHHI